MYSHFNGIQLTVEFRNKNVTLHAETRRPTLFTLVNKKGFDWQKVTPPENFPKGIQACRNVDMGEAVRRIYMPLR